MSTQFSGTVTRKSNGTFEVAPVAGTSDKALPKMGDDVTITVDVTTSVAQSEARAIASAPSVAVATDASAATLANRRK